MVSDDSSAVVGNVYIEDDEEARMLSYEERHPLEPLIEDEGLDSRVSLAADSDEATRECRPMDLRQPRSASSSSS